MSTEYRGPGHARKTLGEFARALEIGIIGLAAGTIWGLYGGLVNWWPLGFDPHFPQPAFLLVYLGSFGFAVFIDLIAHPMTVRVIYERAEEAVGRGDRNR